MSTVQQPVGGDQGAVAAKSALRVIAAAGPAAGRDDAIAQAVKQCIEFRFHGTNKPPEGHWLMEMWEFGRYAVHATPVTRPCRATHTGK